LKWGTEQSKSGIKDVTPLKDSISIDCDWFESLNSMELKLPDDDSQWPDLMI